MLFANPLLDTQSELDSATAQRKILANETEKVAVEISFRMEGHRASAWGQIWNALGESGSTLADSTASLITTIFAVIPWLELWLCLSSGFCVEHGETGSSIEAESRSHHPLPEFTRSES